MGLILRSLKVDRKREFQLRPKPKVHAERPDGRPSFSYHRWGPWTCSIKIDWNFHTTPQLFISGQNVANFDPNFDTTFLFGACHSELEDFFRNLKKIVKDRWWYQPGGVGSPNSEIRWRNGNPKMGPKGLNGKSADCPIWLKFCRMTNTNVPERRQASKLKPKVKIRRQMAFFSNSVLGHISDANQFIFTKFGVRRQWGSLTSGMVQIRFSSMANSAHPN